MADIISIDDLRVAREQRREPKPSVACVARDENGIQWFKFSAEYIHGGDVWVMEIWARDQVDAAERLRSIGKNAKILGQVFEEIPYD